MSKRSYRRLAVVAGAALAVGSVAPAMAAQVNVGGNGNATVNISDVTLPTMDSITSSSVIAQDYALDAVFGAQGLVLDTAGQVQTDVENIMDDLLDATSALAVRVDATGNASTGGVTVQVSGVTTATGLVGALPVPSPTTVVSGVQSNLTPIVDFGLSSATGALGLVGGVQGAAAGGLLGTGLGLLDGIAVSGNASLVAALVGTL